VSEFVRKTIGRFYGVCFGKPSQRARGFAKDVVRDKNIVVGMLAVPARAAQKVADDLVDAGLRIIFNYSEGLLDVPSDVTVYTSNPAVELLHALYSTSLKVDELGSRRRRMSKRLRLEAGSGFAGNQLRS
jgi:CoA binding domain